MYNRYELPILCDGHAKGIVTRNLVTGAIQSWAADAAVLATGGYSNVFYLSTNAVGCNSIATIRAYKKALALLILALRKYTNMIPTKWRSSIRSRHCLSRSATMASLGPEE